MSNKRHVWKGFLLLVTLLVWICSMTAIAEDGSDDNSLSSLGILTEGAVVSPEFSYESTEYNVTVPAGTQSLSLDPVTSNSNAWIVDISGTDLTDGQTTVSITVSAQNGSQYTYYLYVTADGEASAEETAVSQTEAQTEVQTEAQTEKQTETEAETEDPRYVKVDRNSLQEAENTIATLKTEASSYRSRVGMLTKILYGMIAFSVLLLFIVINLLLKKKDLKAELQAYRGYGYEPGAESTSDNGETYEDQMQWQYDGQGYQEQPYDAAEEMQQAYGTQADGGFSPGTAAQETVRNDDPTTVPKPSRARIQRKPMPEYQQPPENYVYQKPQDNQSSEQNIEVTMIDL